MESSSRTCRRGPAPRRPSQWGAAARQGARRVPLAVGRGGAGAGRARVPFLAMRGGGRAAGGAARRTSPHFASAMWSLGFASTCARACAGARRRGQPPGRAAWRTRIRMHTSRAHDGGRSGAQQRLQRARRGAGGEQAERSAKSCNRRPGGHRPAAGPHGPATAPAHDCKPPSRSAPLPAVRRARQGTEPGSRGSPGRTCTRCSSSTRVISRIWRGSCAPGISMVADLPWGGSQTSVARPPRSFSRCATGGAR